MFLLISNHHDIGNVMKNQSETKICIQPKNIFMLIRLCPMLVNDDQQTTIH